MTKPNRTLPKPTPESQHFWEGTKHQKLFLQSCTKCNTIYFPPRPFCPECSCREIGLVEASGEATLDSYVINHRNHPAFEGPYSIAIVKLKEGPRMMSNVVDCPQTPEALSLDMPLFVKFEEVSDEITLPLFRPIGTLNE